MIKRLIRQFSLESHRDKLKIDQRISGLRGPLSQITPKDLRNIFRIDFRDLSSTSEMVLKDSSPNRLSKSQLEFLIKSIASYNNTFPPTERLKPEVDSYDGREANKISHIDHFLRTMILVGYDDGIYLNRNEPILLRSGERRGYSDMIISRDDSPRIIIRLVSTDKHKTRGSDMEYAFGANIFEIYSSYWRNPI